MSRFANMSRVARAATLIAAALLVAACAKGPGGPGSSASLSLTSAAPGTGQDFVVNVGDRVFFETDSSDFTPTAIATLNKQVAWLSQYPRYSFTIEGHADERGTREYNIALGARRAAAVREYFIAHGVNAGRMRTISYGKERPVAVCNDISCWSQNRRAVIVLDNAGV
ncbi:MAG TPA: peptidoglycan-associated lipoprotein Pal [Bauldia sp.]|nr:peptidoglycan-associated lipoprotein Pal [Bauldia sp.]